MSTPRHGRLQTRSVIPRVLRALVLGLAVVVVAAAGVGVVAYSHLRKQLDESSFALPAQSVSAGPTEAVPEIGAYAGEVNILLVGSDTRFGQKGHYGKNPGSALNDVTILLHINAAHTAATALSFPRDLYVDAPPCEDPLTHEVLPAGSGLKINAMLGRGGVGCVRDTVAQLTGLQIPYAGLITFDGVVRISNAVGGVPVCVASRIDDTNTGLHLSAGIHQLKGARALQFLRTRHAVGDGSDLTRISSQQVYLSALLRKVRASLSDVPDLYRLASVTTRSVALSDTLTRSPDTLVTIGRALAAVPLNQIALVQYPTVVRGDGVVANAASAATLTAAIRAGSPLVLGRRAAGSSRPGSVAETPKPSATTAAATASAAPTPAATLPADISGQSAATTTCSVGRPLADQ